MLTELPRVVAEKPDRPDHGEFTGWMQGVTRAIATEPDAWTPERAAEMAARFDAAAAGWRDNDRPERHDALRDALSRGGPFPPGLCLEVGAGTGNATGDLRDALGEVVSLDLSRPMLALASSGVSRVQSDASALPVRAGAVAIVALVNMFLFPAEVARVLRPDGVVVWVSTNGDGTPIYLPPDVAFEALPGEWEGVSSCAGWGTWLTARRSNP